MGRAAGVSLFHEFIAEDSALRRGKETEVLKTANRVTLTRYKPHPHPPLPPPEALAPVDFSLKS